MSSESVEQGPGRRPWVVGVSGASGTPYAVAAIGGLLDAGEAVDLVVSRAARLTILDEKLHASLMSHASEELMLKIRREVDSQLSAYRRKMKAAQLAVVEKQYLQKRLLDEYRLPRLSLFYFA